MKVRLDSLLFPIEKDISAKYMEEFSLIRSALEMGILGIRWIFLFLDLLLENKYQPWFMFIAQYQYLNK